MRTIGIAGTAKNTGKTTTALEIIRQTTAAGLCNALTSIGYDGEEIDNVTGLPKPRYYLPKGTYLATGKRCLEGGQAEYRVVLETKIRTILGPIVVVEVSKPGLVVVAGPNRATDLQRVLEVFRNLGADLAIADGALNRIVPLVHSDGLILCTGAAFDNRITYLADHARALHSLFAPATGKGGAGWGDWITITSDASSALELQTNSLLVDDTLQQIERCVNRPIRDLVIPGACDVRLMQRLLEHNGRFLCAARLIFGSPLKLIASGDPLSWSRLFAEVLARGQEVAYLEKVPLLGFSVNPFYPRYLPKLKAYEPAAVSKENLLAAVKKKLPGFPVFDTKQEPKPDLLHLLGLETARSTGERLEANRKGVGTT